MRRIVAFGCWLTSVLAVLTGAGILVSNVPVRSICRKDGWLNDFLLVLFEHGRARLGLACVWFLAGLWIAYVGYRVQRNQGGVD